MKNHKTNQAAVSVRYGTPQMRTEAGKPIILCPFCQPSHPLSVNAPSACGTVLELRATQAVYKAKLNKGMVCIKCKQGGGTMVQFNDAFIHTHDCTPGVFTFADPPKYSRMARLIYRMPVWIKGKVEKVFGEARAVEEVLPDGTRTGAHLGYFFYQKV